MISIPFDPQTKDLLIIILSTLLLVTLIIIIFLVITIGRERYRKMVPLLTFLVDYDTSGLYLKNISGYPAKNITVKDLEVVLEEDFRKTLTVKFEPIDLLVTNDIAKLNFLIYDGAYKLINIQPDKLVAHLRATALHIQLQYFNLGSIKFESTIVKEKGTSKFVIEKTVPLD